VCVHSLWYNPALHQCIIPQAVNTTQLTCFYTINYTIPLYRELYHTL